MRPKEEKKKPLTQSKAIKHVRIVGVIHLLLALYTILGALVGIGGLSGPTTLNLTMGAFGIVVLVIVWGPALVSGLGLILLTEWGRRLAIKWGKIIIWVLPIAFGLSCRSLSDIFSFGFAVVITIGLYAAVVAENLAKPEYVLAFVRQPPRKKSPDSKSRRDEAARRSAVHLAGNNSETISFECEECGKDYTVQASLAGRKAKCKVCGHKFHIPTATTE